MTAPTATTDERIRKLRSAWVTTALDLGRHAGGKPICEHGFDCPEYARLNAIKRHAWDALKLALEGQA